MSSSKANITINKAIQQILKALHDKQSCITGIQAPNPAKKSAYEKSLKEFSQLRGGHLFFPYISSGTGKGPLIQLQDDSVKYDLINGIGVHLGHSHPKLIEAALNAALEDTIMQGNLQQSEASKTLCKKLTQLSGMDHCFLSSSGAMANENALKILFQHKFPANRILAFEKCFMGRTLGLASITDNHAYRIGLPTTVSVDYVPFYDSSNHEQSIKNTINHLNKHVDRYPNKHVVMCLELIQGEGGFKLGNHEFFAEIIKFLKKNNIKIMIDEIQTFGRTPQLFAFQHFGLENHVDIITIGKTLQTCATCYKSSLKPKPGLISQTFTSSSSAIHAALAILDELTSNQYYGPNGFIETTYKKFESHFKKLSTKYPDLISGPYGIGSMISFIPYQGDREKVIDFIHRLFHAGIISFICGKNPTKVRFLLPPGLLSNSDIQTIFEVLEKTLVEGA